MLSCDEAEKKVKGKSKAETISIKVWQFSLLPFTFQ